MTASAARALGWMSVVLLAAGCSTDADRQDPGSSGGGPSSPLAAEETATGTSARDEPSDDQRPNCHGRRPATILGTRGADRIVGTPDADVIVTYAGDDHVSRLRDGDRVCTGPGNDTVTDVDGADWLDLSAGDDRVTDVEGPTAMRGGAGDDRLTLPIARIDVDAGPGDDTLRVAPGGPPRFPDGIAYNSPCMSYITAVRPVRVDLLRGSAKGQGRDRLVDVHCVQGSRLSDTIVGSPDADDIDPGAGDDQVWSLAGNDTVHDDSYPGAGDVFHLGAGDDSGMSGAGPDRVYGESGDDFIETGAGADYIDGGEGDDVLHASYRCDGGNSGGPGTVDRLPNDVFGGPGDDHLTGDLGNDRIDGGPGSDQGHGGHGDGRIDWMESLETIVTCSSPF